MNKKGSMELSVNSIVILVIAIVMLGLILAFVKSKFTDLDNSLLAEEPAPAVASMSDPITLSRPSLVTGSGKTVAMKVSMYNGEASDAIQETPIFDCHDDAGNSVLDGPGSFNPKDILIGKSVLFEGLIKVGTSNKGKFLCTVTGSSIITAVKDFTIEIK